MLDEKLCKQKYEKILIYNTSYKTWIGPKPLRIRFDKIDGFIKINDKIRYLVLLIIVIVIKLVVRLNIL